MLKAGDLITKAEMLFFTKVCGRYLMNNCIEKDRPTPTEKQDMSKSIIDCFPTLHDGTASGYGYFFDRKSFTGKLEHIVRSRRSNCNDIATLWKHSPPSIKISLVNNDDVESSIRLLREQRPNVQNKLELNQLMEVTRDHRRAWINTASPSITEIVCQYPRFLDMPETILKEFQSINSVKMRLHVQWQGYKLGILEHARSKPLLIPLISCLTNELDEDKKSIVAVECLVWLLPTPPQKAVKKARLHPSVVMENLFFNFKDDTIDSALKTLEDRGVKQPMLLYVSGQYFIKADNTVITLPCCSCFIEALEYLFMAFYVFAVEYPNELRFFYGFLERVLNMKSTVQSSTIADLLRQLTFVQKC